MEWQSPKAHPFAILTFLRTLEWFMRPNRPFFALCHGWLAQPCLFFFSKSWQGFYFLLWHYQIYLLYSYSIHFGGLLLGYSDKSSNISNCSIRLHKGNEWWSHIFLFFKNVLAPPQYTNMYWCSFIIRSNQFIDFMARHRCTSHYSRQ